MNIWLKFNWLKLLAVTFLLGALQEFQILPFAYYQLMNWVVVGASLITAQQANHQNNLFFVWLFILVAVIFNPIAPMYFTTQVWQFSDIVAVGLFLVSFIYLKPSRS